MLYFTDPYTDLLVIWHLGDPLPAVALRRVVEIQADGDELAVILAALRGGMIVNKSDPAYESAKAAIENHPSRATAAAITTEEIAHGN